MPQDPDQIVVAGGGDLYVAPVGTTLPTTDATSLDAAFVSIGYITPDGVGFKDDVTSQDINSWQSLTAIRTIVTGRTPTLSFAAQQWNSTTLKMALGGGDTTIVSAGHAMFVAPAATDTPVQRAIILDAEDGDDVFRFVFPRCELSSGAEFTMSRATEAQLGMTFKVLDPGDNDPMWFLLTSDSEFGS